MSARHRGFTRRRFLFSVGLELVNEHLATHGVGPTDSLDDEEQLDQFLGGLSPEVRWMVEEDWHCFNDIADQGMDYLGWAAHRHQVKLDPGTPRARIAVELYLRHQDVYAEAYDLYVWRTASNMLVHLQFADADQSLPTTVDASAQERLKKAVEKYFRDRVQGDACRIRHYSEDGVEVFLIARGDYLQTHMAWKEGQPQPQFMNPAMEDVLQYNPASRVLSLKTAGRSSDERDFYVQAFAENILGRPEHVPTATSHTVTLEPLRSGDFSFAGNQAIERIVLASINARVTGALPMTLKVGSPDVMRSVARLGVRLADCELKSVKLNFYLRQGDNVSRKPVSVVVTPPERTELNRRRDATVVEAYLREQGVLLA